MEREALVQQLLVLSQEHHRVAVEENWEQWGRIMREKEKLWKRLTMVHSGLSAAKELKSLGAITAWEEKTRKALEQKREETKRELMRIKRAREALQGYRKASKSESTRHFRVVC